MRRKIRDKFSCFEKKMNELSFLFSKKNPAHQDKPNLLCLFTLCSHL